MQRKLEESTKREAEAKKREAEAKKKTRELKRAAAAVAPTSATDMEVEDDAGEVVDAGLECSVCWASHRKRKHACRICALPREGAKPQPVPQAIQSPEVIGKAREIDEAEGLLRIV